MGNTDSIPVVSQVKSGVQLVCGDTDGAARTAENFARECPGVSQITSAVQLITGDVDGAIETQKRCGKGLMNMADGIPVVGHTKGIIHYACGDKEGGHKAMKSATRTTGVMAGGAGGFFLGGPAGAVAGGIYGGTLTDLGTTVITDKPSGYIAAIDNAVKNPNAGDIFDLCMMPVSDGIAGYSGGNIAKKVQVNVLKSKAQAVYNAAEANQMHVPEMQTINEMGRAQNLFNKAEVIEGRTPVFDLKTGKTVGNKAGSLNARVVQGAAAQNILRPGKPSTLSEKEDDSEEKECTCQNVTVKVLYVNIRSMNPYNKTESMRTKLENFRAIIENEDPDLIAVVETWLNDRHENENLTILNGYNIFRQDRCRGHHPDNAYGDTESEMQGRRGGGILLAWRRIATSDSYCVKRAPAEDFADNLMSFEIDTKFNCKKCNRTTRNKKFGFTIVYRRPVSNNNETNGRIKDRLVHMGSWVTDKWSNYRGWCLVGDFNWNSENEEHKKLLDDVLTFLRGIASFRPMSLSITHRSGAALDRVLATNGLVPSEVTVSTHPVSDHHALLFTMQLGKDYLNASKCTAERCTAN